MRRLSTRIEALEAGAMNINLKVKEAYQSGIITDDEFQFYIKHDGSIISPIWIETGENEIEKRFKMIGQRIGIIPKTLWQ